MNVSLDEHFGKLVKQILESGEFSSDTEVVQAGLQLLEKRQQKLGRIDN
ncbi:MAG: type II toxin-antitoxin system ParD family antitoxin [Chloroflexi bacterium]|nr:type II toxin-antitoxin system ParD family antitoxin [Chloroflexota bacterium]